MAQCLKWGVVFSDVMHHLWFPPAMTLLTREGARWDIYSEVAFCGFPQHLLPRARRQTQRERLKIQRSEHDSQRPPCTSPHHGVAPLAPWASHYPSNPAPQTNWHRSPSPDDQTCTDYLPRCCKLCFRQARLANPRTCCRKHQRRARKLHSGPC